MTPKWLKFNDEIIQNPDDGTWSESFGIIEQLHETEAGTTQTSVTRYGRLTASARWTVSQARKKYFEAIVKSGIVNVEISGDTDEGDAQIVRKCILRDVSATLIGFRFGVAFYELSMKIQEL